MTTTEKETLQRVQEGLYHLVRGLTPFVEARMEARHGVNWSHYTSGETLDAHGLLKTMLDNWRGVFGEAFERTEKHEVHTFTSTAFRARNRAAHPQPPIKDNEALRFLDAIHQLLTAVKASEREVAELKHLYDAQRHCGLSAPDCELPEPPPPRPPTPEPPSNPHLNYATPDIGAVNNDMRRNEAIRRVSQRCRLAVINGTNTHFANINKTRRDIWWLNIPLERVKGSSAKDIVNLLLYHNLSGKIYHLRVPTSYLFQRPI